MEDKNGLAYETEESEVDVHIRQTKAQPQGSNNRPKWLNGCQLNTFWKIEKNKKIYTYFEIYFYANHVISDCSGRDKSRVQAEGNFTFIALH